jgi:hypothetical protein
MSTLIDEYGSERVRAVRDQLVADLLWADRPDELDDWRLCGIDKAEDIRDLFVPNFFFGCEGDDRLNAAAFDTERNPFGARLGAMFGSDIGHFDVPDMRLVVVEAFELVEDNLISMDDFRDFAFANAVRLHGGANADFFKGTAVEKEAAEILATDAASSGGPAARSFVTARPAASRRGSTCCPTGRSSSATSPQASSNGSTSRPVRSACWPTGSGSSRSRSSTTRWSEPAAWCG